MPPPVSARVQEPLLQHVLHRAGHILSQWTLRLCQRYALLLSLSKKYFLIDQKLNTKCESPALLTISLVASCLAPIVANGAVDPATLTVGSTVALRCDEGYYDPYNNQLKCSVSGELSQDKIACKRKLHDGNFSGIDLNQLFIGNNTLY